MDTYMKQTSVVDIDGMCRETIDHFNEPRSSAWSDVTPGGFWDVADSLQSATLKHANMLFPSIVDADHETLKRVLIQYRYFTVYYIPDLALLITRIRDGKLRSFLADILSDELGYGDPDNAHPRLYDMFLESIGVEKEILNSSALQNNINLLDDARKSLVSPHNSGEFCIGLRGMGGECVCQIYIAQLYEYLINNKYIMEHAADINWKFWELHVGDHDIQHRIKTRSLIDEEVVNSDNRSAVASLGRGYVESLIAWKAYWENIFDLIKSSSIPPQRVTTYSTVTYPINI